jgi:cell division protein FtsB
MGHSLLDISNAESLRRATRLLAWFAIVVLVVGVFRGQSSIGTYFQLKESAAKLQTVVSDLEADNRAMQLEIDRIKSSKSYARKVLRDKYHVLEGDEKIIFFTE